MEIVITFSQKSLAITDDKMSRRSTFTIWDNCDPVFNEKFTIPVRADKMNELRLEVYDHDDDPVDQTPDFLGQVVLRGSGSDGLPDVQVRYPLTKKTRLN